jgi:hypothetical protein
MARISCESSTPKAITSTAAARTRADSVVTEPARKYISITMARSPP